MEALGDLRCNATAQVDARRSHHLEGQIASLRSEDLNEDIKRLLADCGSSFQRDSGDHRSRITLRQLFRQPGGLLGSASLAEEAVDVVQPRPRKHPLVA